MAVIDYRTFRRLVSRCGEIAAEPGMKASVVMVYESLFAAQAKAYLDADDGVAAAASAFAKENKEAAQALVALDGAYREARSVTAAFVSGIKLPDTLKMQPTDTDKLDAIQGLLDILDEHTGEKWADSLLAGDFGAKAPLTIKEVTEAIGANKALTEARHTRAEAYGPAYERYVQLKRVVRDALGPTSKQYKRIHLRAQGSGAEEEKGEGEPKPEGKDK